MHGRIRVRTSAEEAARKKKEQELKVKAYKAGISKIFEKRLQNELDDEMLLLTGQILSKNPEVYTLWNIRKEYLLVKNKELVDDEETLQALFNKDLNFTEQCLMVNPKSYCVWHHRCWILENCPKANWEHEVMLCTKYLKLDERNFHCWDYRRYVVEKAKILPEKELQFCTEKIQNNFSNYSSWHYRSKLLPILYPHETDKSRPINEDKLKSELELVLTAAFTDPNDSSAWFYQRWLLGYSYPSLNIAACRISEKFAVISFTKAINLSEYKINSNCDIIPDNIDWKPSTDGCIYDTTWIVKHQFNLKATNNDLIVVTCSSKNGEKFEINLKKTLKEDSFCGINCPKFEYEFGASVIEVLKGQLDSCLQLLELEPDSKWTLLTAALLMRAINRREHHVKSCEYLQKLEKIDSYRKGYYQDLASKWNIEKALEEWIVNPTEFPYKVSLSEMNLTTLNYEQYFSIADEINLSANCLTNRIIPKFKVFQFCQVLDLTNNKFDKTKNKNELQDTNNDENDYLKLIFKKLNINCIL